MSKINETFDSIKASENFKEKTTSMLIDSNNSTSANTSAAKKESWFKKWSSKKRILAGSTAAVLLLCAIIIPLLIILNGNTKNKYDGWFINFSKYSSFGMGTVPAAGANLNTLANNQTASAFSAANLSEPSGSKTASAFRTATVAAAAGTADTDKSRLIGITPLGKIEEIVFEKRNSSGEVEKEEVPKMNITKIDSFTKFTFIQFYVLPQPYGGNWYFENREGDCEFYVIDNYTGKIYGTSDFSGVYMYGILGDVYGDYGSDVLDVGDCIYVNATASKDFFSHAVYKMYVNSNEELVMEEILDSDLDFDFSSLRADKFENLYFRIHDSNYYIYKAADKTISLTSYTKAYKAFNGKVYADSTHFYNENGVLTESAQSVDLTAFSNEQMIYREGNDFYYYKGPDLNYNDKLKVVYKVTKIDVDRFTVATTDLEDYTATYIALGTKIFYQKTDKVFYIDIKTGKVLDEVKDYIFSSIEADNLGGILFTGKDNKLNNVNGVIDSDGKVSILTTPRTVKIYYIKPIN